VLVLVWVVLLLLLLELLLRLLQAVQTLIPTPQLEVERPVRAVQTVATLQREAGRLMQSEVASSGRTGLNVP